MSNDIGPALLLIARKAIAEKLGVAYAADPPSQPELTSFGATFVTLMEHGQLRGCIGSLEALRPLRDDVAANARAAAFSDTRFEPLQAKDFAEISVEVSLLSRAQPMSFSSEEDALRQLRPNVDGLILECGRHRATFLPQVWESLSEPRQFMAQLKRKADLPATFWSDDVRLSCYTVDKWKEQK